MKNPHNLILPSSPPVDRCSAMTWIAHTKLGTCLLVRKRLFKARLRGTLRGAWFEEEVVSVRTLLGQIQFPLWHYPLLEYFIERFKNNLIAWFVMLVDGRSVCSAVVMAILLNWALLLLWCFRSGSWVMALFRNEPCIRHCDTL